MIQTITIDDEPLALQLITGYIKKTPFLDFKGAFDNPVSAFEYIENNHVDLIYLDIQMPDLSGVDFAKSLTDNKIIFTTAYEKYALEGFKLEAIDYLLKPFSYDEFLNSAKKAKKYFDLTKSNLENINANNEFLFVKSNYRIKRINFKDIKYIEGLKEYVKIFLINENEPILSLISLKTLESKLPESMFMRIHRSFIVNLNQIDTIERSRIVFGKIYVPISDQYRDKFQEFVDKNFGHL